jgi:hypothetical protein
VASCTNLCIAVSRRLYLSSDGCEGCCCTSTTLVARARDAGRGQYREEPPASCCTSVALSRQNLPHPVSMYLVGFAASALCCWRSCTSHVRSSVAAASGGRNVAEGYPHQLLWT